MTETVFRARGFNTNQKKTKKVPVVGAKTFKHATTTAPKTYLNQTKTTTATETYYWGGKKEVEKIIVEEVEVEKVIVEIDDGPMCAICYDTQNEGEQEITLDCNHTFHAACSDNWFAHMRNCPSCRDGSANGDEDY